MGAPFGNPKAFKVLWGGSVFYLRVGDNPAGNRGGRPVEGDGAPGDEPGARVGHAADRSWARGGD